MTKKLIEFHAQGKSGNLFTYEDSKTGKITEERRTSSWDPWVEKIKHPDLNLELPE